LQLDANGQARVQLVTPEDGVAAGQACVLYEDDDPQARILGGGTIARALKQDDDPAATLAAKATESNPNRGPVVLTRPH